MTRRVAGAGSTLVVGSVWMLVACIQAPSLPPSITAVGPSASPTPSGPSRATVRPSPAERSSPGLPEELDHARGNPLLPLSSDLTWVYRQQLDQGRGPAFGRVVNAIVGVEQVDGEDAWIYERSIGTATATRWVVVDRAGDIWALAVDELHHEVWTRRPFATPQLLQPVPGERSWTLDWSHGFADQGGELDETATLRQKRAADVSALGTTAVAWQVLIDRTSHAGSAHESTTIAEGLGAIESIIATDDGEARLELIQVRASAPPIDALWHGTLVGAETWIGLTGGTGGIEILDGDGPSSARDWQITDDSVAFRLISDGAPFDVRLRLEPWGLVGTATDASRRDSVAEFIEDVPNP